jgi:hypothetical protein
MKKNLTTEKLEVPANVIAAKITPEFIRLPKAGQLCPHTGLTRSYLNSLVLPSEDNNHRPPVESVALRQKGHVRGIRLISYSSLIGHLQRQAA